MIIIENLKFQYPEELITDYPDDTILLGNIIERYDLLQENQIVQAYQLSKDSLQIFNRFCYIKHDIKKKSSRGKDAALKDWLKEICDYLYMVSTQSRMVWKFAKENVKNNEEL
ncbi:hypothetical protein [Clostridium beijerinckii]|uniref:hypothetical protein n=1 Tax=Clostridium beijerinckii TaxID=1520 RepID=UPI001F1CD3C5|nr:hypothetical protein [Clostridium beijerinckii]